MSEEKKNSKGLSINFGLKSFDILKYDYEESGEKIDTRKIGYQIQFRPDADLNEGTISIEFKIIGQAGEEDPIELGSIHTLTTYHISSIDELLTDDGNLLIPKGLAISLLSIALSTTRGALIAKSEGNILSKEILPLADPKEMYEASPLKGEIEIK
ncbi:hypothetical protein [Fodinibius salsisoli]|uniref:Preprotein translocase subunit SecB n=1 Tax=Fodinibius salsisoli TaxID=2820877 RepID=A0ABT3PTM4_9BACT|nr:hypothetical protein [Fodinibius salsisoli]MCW9709206.1 hypothetical protein [Fodinibius salsisoli]